MTLGMQKEETLKLVKFVTTLFFGKWITKSMEGKDPGTPDAAMHRLHIRCTMRANHSFAIRGNAEFFTCGKAIMGNLRNVPHLIFCKLPRTNFAALNRQRHLYSAGRPSRWALAHILVCDTLRSITAIWILLIHHTILLDRQTDTGTQPLLYYACVA